MLKNGGLNMKKIIKSFISLLLVFLLAICANVSVSAEATSATESSYEFNEETGELRLYSEQWGDDLDSDWGYDENDIIESQFEKDYLRATYDFLLKIRKLYLGKGVSFSSSFFQYAINLQEISVDPNHEDYSVFDNVLYTKDKKTLLKCPLSTEDKNIIIAEECEKFDDFSFSWLDLQNDYYITVEADNEYPNFRQKRVNLVFTRKGQFKELFYDSLFGKEAYIDNVYVPETQEEIASDGYNNFSCMRTASWIATSYHYACSDEEEQIQFNLILKEKQVELYEKYYTESENDVEIGIMMGRIANGLLNFLVDEGYTDNLEENIKKYALLFCEQETETLLNCVKSCYDNIMYVINNRNCVKPLTNYIDNEKVITGKCGENVYYTFNNENGLLTISGTGDMYYSDNSDFSTGNNEILTDTEFEYEGILLNPAKFGIFDVKKVSIESGVTSIPANAFSGCNNLSEVELSESVKRINDGAFFSSGLKSVLISDDIEYIGKSVFPDECDNILVKKDSITENTLKNANYKFIPYSLTERTYEDKDVLSLDSKVVLSEDMWSCISRLIRDTDVYYIYFEELEFGDMMPEEVLENFDKNELVYKQVMFSIVKDGETVRLSGIEEKSSFRVFIETLIDFFTITVSQVIKSFMAFIKRIIK